MNRTLPLSAAVVLALVLAACSHPGQAPRTARPVVHGTPDCFDPAFARGFREIDDNVLLVDAGARDYLVEVEPSCWNIDSSAALAFKGDSITGRVCGRFNDTVSGFNETCRVMRVERLTPEQVELLTAEPEDAADAPAAE